MYQLGIHFNRLVHIYIPYIIHKYLILTIFIYYRIKFIGPFVSISVPES